jgi:hypothetical protein
VNKHDFTKHVNSFELNYTYILSGNFSLSNGASPVQKVRRSQAMILPHIHTEVRNQEQRYIVIISKNILINQSLAEPQILP